MKKFLLLLVTTILVASQSFGQTKMIVGQKHLIFVDIPKGWLQAQNDPLPFFIKPDLQNVSNQTYMYVYGIDYKAKPALEGWIKGNNDYVSKQFKGVKIDSLDLKFDNIKTGDYTTGNYIVITYTYTDGKKEVLLIVECVFTIVTAVLSAKDQAEFDLFLPSFVELSKSLKISGATLKVE